MLHFSTHNTIMTTDPNDAIDANLHQPESYQDAQVDRKVLHLLVTHSDMRALDAQKAYDNSYIYPKRAVWLDFAHKFFLSIGTLMMLAGIIFFFAYNWSDLHKFAKLGTIQVGIVATAIGLLLYKKDDYIRKLGLTVISVLVGVFFAVFGQIYQTGANAYDFFLGWTIFVAAWVTISGFPFLWLFFLLLVNLTIGFYIAQVLRSWDDETMFLLFSGLNIAALAIWEWVVRNKREEVVNLWCLRIIGAGITYSLTTNMIIIIFDDFSRSSFDIFGVLFYLLWIGIGGWYYVQQVRDISFAAMIPFSLIVIIDSLILNMGGIGDFIGIFLLVTIFTIGSTTGLVFYLLRLYKSWTKNSIENTL
ncbi:MAG: DUF2157 domain-containing protein [Aureispira sp.]|nr:DUF2157 domain-containing protein [Aureispira sp.]